MSTLPPFESMITQSLDQKIVDKIEKDTLFEAYKLLTKVSGSELQIATSESLTAGLIMSTLVKIPWAGWHKYGCTGVYDTDAKRVFNNVEVDDVYTHTCAKEMAIGLLANSNATLAIAVTGNAMPYFDHRDMLGEVFIGVAGYTGEKEDPKIAFMTKSINACLKGQGDIKTLCDDWLKAQPNKDSYAPRSKTAAVSLFIRNFTASQAYKMCGELIDQRRLIAPSFIEEQKRSNGKIFGSYGGGQGHEKCYHTNLPQAKYPHVFLLDTECLSEEIETCEHADTCKRVGTREIPSDILSDASH